MFGAAVMWQDMTDTNAIKTQAREAVIHPRGRDMLFLYPKVSRAHTTLGRKCPIGAPPRCPQGGAAAYSLGVSQEGSLATMVLPGVAQLCLPQGSDFPLSPGNRAPDKSQSAEHTAPTGNHSATQTGMLVPAEDQTQRLSQTHKALPGFSSLAGFLRGKQG